MHTHLQVVAIENSRAADSGHYGTLCIIVIVAENAIKIHGGVVVDRLPVAPLAQVIAQASALAAGEKLNALHRPP